MNKIINEFEYIANKSLDNNEGIHVIFLADLKENNKHYYFVCSEDNEFTFKLNNMDNISNDEIIDDNNLGQ